VYICSQILSLLSFPLLILSRMWFAALIVPADPVQPLLVNQFTSFGVRAAVNPTLNGRKSVLWTVYARRNMAIRPSLPPFDAGCW